VRVLSPGLLLCLVTASSAYAAETVEILRDNFGTPHIFARTSAGAAYGAGYAQAEDRKDALLRNLRSVETEQAALSPALPPAMQGIVEAFAAGVNRFLGEHSDAGSSPITPAMVVAYSRQALGKMYSSNDVLIGPSRSTSGNVIAILDPLSGWNDDARPYEMRWYASDEQIALSGVAPAGVPFPIIGHGGSAAIGWGGSNVSGSAETAGPRALEQAWAMITARNLAGVQEALRLRQIPGIAMVGTSKGEILDSSGTTPDQGVLVRPRNAQSSEEGVRKLLAAQNAWPFGRIVDLAFSTAVYKAETWQARLVKFAPELRFVQMLTGWNRRADAASQEALAFYLFKMALGQPESAALEPPGSLSDNRIRAALRKAQDQVETQLPYRADYGTMFRMTREGSSQSTPVGGGIVTEAGMITPRAITFQRAGQVMLGRGGQSATQIVELSNPIRSVSILVPGENDRPESGHFDDQARELFSKGTAKPTYFGDRKGLEKHLSSKKELIF
jgi:acyl-homoserine lactone acylase PvdQ